MPRSNKSHNPMNKNESAFRVALFKIIAMTVIASIFGATPFELFAVILATEAVLLIFSIWQSGRKRQERDDAEDQ